MSNSALDIQCVRTSQFLTVLDEQEVIYSTKDSIYTFTYLFNNFIYLLIFAVSLLLLGLLVAVAPLIAECGLLGFSTVALGLQSTGSVAVVHRGLAAPQHAGSSRIRDQICVSCIGRWLLYHWANQGSPRLSFFIVFCI